MDCGGRSNLLPTSRRPSILPTSGGRRSTVLVRVEDWSDTPPTILADLAIRGNTCVGVVGSRSRFFGKKLYRIDPKSILVNFVIRSSSSSSSGPNLGRQPGPRYFLLGPREAKVFSSWPQGGKISGHRGKKRRRGTHCLRRE